MLDRIVSATLAEIFLQAGERWDSRPAFFTRSREGNFQAVTYRAWCDRALSLATALIELGVAARDHVGLLSDNRFEWILADAAVQFCGAADVPRASDSSDAEIVAILKHADIKVLFVENRGLLSRLESLHNELPQLTHIIVMEDENLHSYSTTAANCRVAPVLAASCTLSTLLSCTPETPDTSSAAAAMDTSSAFLPPRILSLQALEADGKRLRSLGDRSVEERISQIQPEDLFTIIYTSGTTGPAKGVQLTHRAICSQIKNIPLDVLQNSTDAANCAVGPVLALSSAFSRLLRCVPSAPCTSLASARSARRFTTIGLRSKPSNNYELSTSNFSASHEQERALSILPVWHSYERVFEMLLITEGASLYYTSVRHLARDLVTVKPTVMASAPRVWEALYEKIMARVAQESVLKKNLFAIACWSASQVRSAARFFRGEELLLEKRAQLQSWSLGLQRFLQWGLGIIPFLILDPLILKNIRKSLGGAFRSTISGGGALPPHIDAFFQEVGIRVFEGYGLTESCPVLAVRTMRSFVLGTVGPPLPETEIKIVDLVSGEILYPDSSRADRGRGRRGEICARGPQIMKGYYKDPEGTARVLQNGWLHTGDIGLMTFNDCLKIVGRCKETIVLLNGENVEPLPIESKLLESSLIEQCMVVGQDQKQLGVLIVPSLAGLAERGISAASFSELLEQEKKMTALFQEEIRYLVSAAHGFKSFERIGPWRLIPKAFEVGEELTPTYKLKRHVIEHRYGELIEKMF